MEGGRVEVRVARGGAEVTVMEGRRSISSNTYDALPRASCGRENGSAAAAWGVGGRRLTYAFV
jgi:hypothetical protein